MHHLLHSLLPGTQSPGIFTFTGPPHKRLQLGLDVRVEHCFLVVDMKSSQDGLLLGWHALDNQRALDHLIPRLILYRSPIDIAAIVLPATR